MEQEAEIDFKDRYGRAALFYAMQWRQLSIAQLFLQGGADPNTTEYNCAMLILHTPDILQLPPDLEVRNASNDIAYQTPLFLLLEMETTTWSSYC